MGELVELRGPCNHLAATLDTERGIIQRKCPQCSREAGQPVYHYFDAVTGEPVTVDEAGAPHHSVPWPPPALAVERT